MSKHIGTKHKYEKPVLTVHGKVEEITKSGTNMPYSDGMGGTRPFK